jgi:hypothetical protein
VPFTSVKPASGPAPSEARQPLKLYSTAYDHIGWIRRTIVRAAAIAGRCCIVADAPIGGCDPPQPASNAAATQPESA